MNEKEFIDNVLKYKDEFYRFLKRNLTNTSSVEDVFSEAILTAFEKKDEFKDGTNFRAWMYKILANKCFIHNREKFNYFEPLDEHEEIPSPESVWKRGNVKVDLEQFLESCSDEVYKAFIQLPLLQRLCIYLKDVEEFSYKEIAEILGIPLPSVMTYLSRGRANLRKNLIEQIKNENTFTNFSFIPLYNTEKKSKSSPMQRSMSRVGLQV